MTGKLHEKIFATTRKGQELIQSSPGQLLMRGASGTTRKGGGFSLTRSGVQGPTQCYGVVLELVTLGGDWVGARRSIIVGGGGASSFE